ncbi:MAG TPA: preprotein translocase subunit SecE [Thermomicrobiales bacterium]|nr:preprotein translocase subunit SecE [Thermomicrobiales bacterium]
MATAPSNKTEKRTRPTKPAKGEAPKQNIIAVRTERLRGLVQDTMSEMRKINWPDQETTRNLTIVVIGISVALGILLGGIDYLLVQLLGLF